MATKRQENPVRETDLLRTLGDQVAPRPVSWLVLVGLIFAGSALLLLLVSSLGPLRRKPQSALEQPADQALLSAAVSAYERADWDGAERLFRTIHERFPDNARSQDYLDRIELTRRDAEILARAEEALVAGQPVRARQLSERVAPNSRLFAQAEGLTRSAMAQDATAPADRSAEVAGQPPAVDVRAALGEAQALYEDGRFAEAVQRAEGLAQRATGPVQIELSQWANDAGSFGKIYLALPTDEPSLLLSLGEVQTAVELDERVSDGHYAHGLRLRAAKALTGRATALGQNGHLIDACGELVRARAFAGRALTFREGGNPVLDRRCETEAARRVNQARTLERKRSARGPHDGQLSPEARALFEQARAMSLPTSAAHVAAEQALARP